MTPMLLSRIISCDILAPKVKLWLESVSHACLSASTHEWIQHHAEEKKPLMRNVEINPPSALENCNGCIAECEKKPCATNLHKHSFACEKTKRGNFMCRLGFARGVNEK